MANLNLVYQTVDGEDSVNATNYTEVFASVQRDIVTMHAIVNSAKNRVALQFDNVNAKLVELIVERAHAYKRAVERGQTVEEIDAKFSDKAEMFFQAIDSLTGVAMSPSAE